MAVSKGIIRLLMREGKREQFKGKVLQLGRQEIWATEQILEEIAKEEGFKLSEPRCAIECGKSKFWDIATINDSYFFQRLGFESVDSLDQSTFENATIIHDLNNPLEKECNYRGSYNLVLDGGTMEHVFHIPNTLENIFDLLSVDGRIIHINPINTVNHGFYSFSPIFFEDFYGTNGFHVNEFGLMKFPTFEPHNNWLYTPCGKNSQFTRSFNPTLFDGALFLVIFIATKLSDSTGNKIPQQGLYVETWDPSKDSDEVGNSGLVHGNSPLKSIYAKLITIPALKYIARYLRDKYANSLIKWEAI